jgi:hypothetical protein
VARANLRFVVFPSDDPALVRDVRDAIQRLPEALAEDVARANAQHDLRRWYRSVVIHERDAFGAYPDDPTTVWYVYRDGRVRRPNDGLDRLYAALASARTTCAASAQAIATARTLARTVRAGDRPGPRQAADPVIARRPAPSG